MKKWNVVFGLVVVLSLAVVPMVWAQGPWPTAAGTSGVQAVNMDSQTGDVIPLYVSETGTKYYLPSQSLDPGKSYNWYAEPSSVTSFRGAVVLESDVQIAAIAKTEWPAGGAQGAAAYGGSGEGATEVLLPLLVIQHYCTTSALTVQNTDLNNAISVDLEFKRQGQVPFTKSMNIQAGASATWDMAFGGDFVDPSPASQAGWVGRAIVSSPSGTPVVATAHTTCQTGGFVYAYSGFTNLSQTEAFAPLVRRNYGNLTTGIQVGDASGNGGTVQVVYSGFVDSNSNWKEDPGEAYTYTDSKALSAGDSITFYQGSAYWNNPSLSMPKRFLGSAQVTVTGAGSAIAVVVNDQSDPAYKGKQTASAYNGFFAGDATDISVSPLARNMAYNFTTGIQVQNIGGDTVDVQVVYATSPLSPNKNTPPSKTVSVTSGRSANFYLPVDWGTGTGKSNWVGSADFTATGVGEKLIVAITNDQDVSPPITGDTAIFNCFSK